MYPVHWEGIPSNVGPIAPPAHAVVEVGSGIEEPPEEEGGYDQRIVL